MGRGVPSSGVDLELTDKVAVVQELAAEGAKVVAGARHLESLAGIGGVTPLAVDLADAGGPEELVGYAVDRRGAWTFSSTTSAPFTCGSTAF